MESVILVIHLFLALAIIGLVLLQRSEGGGLGIGGSSGGLGGVASPKSMGNVLTKATGICAAAFFCTSLTLGILAGTHTKSEGILDMVNDTAVQEAPAEQIQIPEDTTSEVETETATPEEVPVSAPVEPAPAVPISE